MKINDLKKFAFICELQGTPRQGGEIYAMARLAESFKKLGKNVDIFSYTSENPDLKINSNIQLKFRLLPFIRDMVFTPIIGKSLLKKIETKYDIIFTGSTAIAALYNPKIPVIIICHAIRSQKFEKLAKIPKYKILFNPVTYSIISHLEKNSFKRAKKIIVLREHQKNFLVNALNIEEEKISIIPNGIDADLFTPQQVEKKNQVIFVGRGTVPKGFDTLLKASDKIKAEILVVTQKMDEDLKSLAETKKNVHIKFKATAEELSKLYSESKVFTLPSLDEEQPLTTMEAMSCELPGVVTAEAAADLVQDKINGYIIEPSNAEDLANKCNSLLSDTETAKKMGERNREKIISQYSLVKICDDILGLEL